MRIVTLMENTQGRTWIKHLCRNKESENISRYRCIGWIFNECANAWSGFTGSEYAGA